MAEFGLGAHLIGLEAITREQLEDALQAQVVYGGRLGTNLVELGILTLDQLAEHLASLFGVPLPPKEWVEAPDPQAIALLPRQLADEHGAFPLRVEGMVLHMAFIDPSDTRVIAKLTRVTGRSIERYTLPELRLRYAQERHLHIARPLRLANAVRKRERVRQKEAVELHDRHEEVRLREAICIGALGENEDLIDESSFAALHPKLEAARERAAGGPVTNAAAPFPHDAVALEALLVSAPDRDSAARAALAIARLHVEAAALLVVHRGMVTGVLGSGGELERHIEGVQVPIDADSVLASVAASGEPYRGAPSEAPIDARIWRTLDRSGAHEISILPIALAGRIVSLLYVDAGPKPLAESAIGAMQALTLCVARAYERLILARKRASDLDA